MADKRNYKAYVHTYGKPAPSSANVVVRLCKDRNNAHIFISRDQAERYKKEFNLGAAPFTSGDGSAFIFEAFQIEEGSENCFWIYGEGPFASDILVP